MIRSRLAGDAQIDTEEGGVEFGDLSRQIDDQTPKGTTASLVFVREHDREDARCLFGSLDLRSRAASTYRSSHV